MEKIIILLQDVSSIVQIKEVTVYGLLIGIIVLLLMHIKRLERKNEKENDQLREALISERETLIQEYRHSNKEVKLIIEKYATLVTRIAEILKMQL